MKKRRRVTEEDLIITEALITESYGSLKKSVIQVPSQAYSSVDQTIREHPYATTTVAIIAGVAVYGIIKQITSQKSASELSVRSQFIIQKETSRPDFIQEIKLLIVPIVTSYIMDFFLKYMEKIQFGKRN